MRIVTIIGAERSPGAGFESASIEGFMRKAIGIFALVLATGWCGTAQSGGWSGRSARTGGFMERKVGACPPGVPGCSDDIWCPVYSYFSYNPGARRQETLHEYIAWSRGQDPGMNPDVFSIPPLPYGRGRTSTGALHTMTTAPAPAPAAAVTAPAGAAAPTPPAIP